MNLFKLVTATFIVTAALLIGIEAFAEIKDVKITTFRAAGDRRVVSAAELCGYVDFVDEDNIRIEVTVDGDRVPTYSVPATKEGRFCLVINTYHGRATVSAIGKDSKESDRTRRLSVGL